MSEKSPRKVVPAITISNMESVGGPVKTALKSSGYNTGTMSGSLADPARRRKSFSPSGSKELLISPIPMDKLTKEKEQDSSDSDDSSTTQKSLLHASNSETRFRRQTFGAGGLVKPNFVKKDEETLKLEDVDDPLDPRLNYQKMEVLPPLPEAPSPVQDLVRWQQYQRLKFQHNERAPKNVIKNVVPPDPSRSQSLSPGGERDKKSGSRSPRAGLKGSVLMRNASKHEKPKGMERSNETGSRAKSATYGAREMPRPNFLVKRDSPTTSPPAVDSDEDDDYIDPLDPSVNYERVRKLPPLPEAPPSIKDDKARWEQYQRLKFEHEVRSDKGKSSRRTFTLQSLPSSPSRRRHSVMPGDETKNVLKEASRRLSGKLGAIGMKSPSTSPSGSARGSRAGSPRETLERKLEVEMEEVLSLKEKLDELVERLKEKKGDEEFINLQLLILMEKKSSLKKSIMMVENSMK